MIPKLREIPSYAAHDKLEEEFGCGVEITLYVVQRVQGVTGYWPVESYFDAHLAETTKNAFNNWCKENRVNVDRYQNPPQYYGASGSIIIPYQPTLPPAGGMGIQSGYGTIASGDMGIYHHIASGGWDPYVPIVSTAHQPDPRESLICPFDANFKWYGYAITYQVSEVKLRI